MSFKNIIMSFEHLYNIHMSLKDFASRCRWLSTKTNHNDHITRNQLMCCVWCSNQMRIRELWDSMFGLHPTDLRLEWWLQNREHLVPYLKTSPMDWLNYYVSGWWLTSPQLKLQIIILKMWAESCSVRCKQLVWCKETIIWHVLSCLWQDQLVFFNLVKAVDAWDWDSDKNFKFKVLEEEHDEECDEWNAESTLKLKEVVVSAREQFKWQTTGADDSLKSKSFEAWLEPRNLALRPLYWEISSEAYTAFKT